MSFYSHKVPFIFVSSQGCEEDYWLYLLIYEIQNAFVYKSHNSVIRNLVVRSQINLFNQETSQLCKQMINIKVNY